MQPRYFFIHQNSLKIHWEEILMTYRSNPSNNYEMANIWEICDDVLPVEKQFECLSLLPNYHKWQWNGPVKKLRHEQRFSTSCRNYPASPRNRIIQSSFYRKENPEIIEACLFNILGVSVSVNYPVSEKKVYKSINQKTKRRRLSRSNTEVGIVLVISFENRKVCDTGVSLNITYTKSCKKIFFLSTRNNLST